MDLGYLRGDLHRRTKANGRGEAAQNPSGVEIRPRRSKLEIRVEIFRRDFRAIQLRKYRFWRVLMEVPSILPSPNGRGGDNTLALGELMSNPMVALASSVEMTWRGPLDSFYLGQEGSEISIVWGDHGRPVLRWRGKPIALIAHGGFTHEESSLVAIHPSVEEKTNIMTLEELNALGTFIPFPPVVQIRLPEEEETITSTRPGEVAFYEAAFPAGLRFPVHNTIRYSISLSEFRNLFSLNINPKPDQTGLYFKARNKKVLLGGYPSNVKGWKSKFFFVSGDEWEIPEEKSRKGAARVRGHKHCNNPPRLFDDEMKVFEEIFRSVEESGRFSVPVLLDSKSFHRVFASPGSRASRTASNHPPSGEAVSSSSDVGESRNPHEQARRESPSRDDSIVCLGPSDRMRSSNPSSESCSDSSQPVELESDAMSKRVSFKKIGEKLGKAAGASSGTPAPAKGVVIGKGVDIGLRAKKKASSSSKTSAAHCRSFTPRGRDLGSSQRCSGSAPSILGSPSVAERLLRGVIPPADKKNVEKLTLDQTATKLFPRDRQGWCQSFCVPQQGGWRAGISSGGRVASMETEVARLQKLAADFEQQLAESHAREQQSLDELPRRRESAVEEFKSSSEFMVAVEDAASKYFGEGLTFAMCNFADIIPTSLSILKELGRSSLLAS
ncbi:hypothetical protein Acr_11g0008390 [Actinidia rufa]|uniref:Uncharacterized protein n=1 Tax=Actinidia rufa TaxID=165716 RepID=A0A7J0FD85_9ERIC|nr:hypothetical protein Acr_11g0008390 [Actinidia rufa]